MASIIFLTRDKQLIGSALGFYASTGFGKSVTVDSYQGSTFVTNSNGTVQGVSARNVTWRHANSGTAVGADPINLLSIPNDEATLNLRFTHSTAINVQNPTIRLYDRVNIDNGPSGVTAKTAEIIHPQETQNNTGSGDSSWTTPKGSGVTHVLTDSPGVSGLHAGLSEPASVRHDWYLALSELPTSIGSKTNNALYFSVEYF